MAHHTYEHFARASAKIDATDADYAAIISYGNINAGDLVVNRPDLSNRPIRLFAEKIKDIGKFSARICHPAVRVVLPSEDFFNDIRADYGLERKRTMDARLPAMKTAFERAGCEVILLR